MSNNQSNSNAPVWLQRLFILGSRDVAYGIVMVAVAFCIVSALFIRLFVPIDDDSFQISSEINNKDNFDESRSKIMTESSDHNKNDEKLSQILKKMKVSAAVIKELDEQEFTLDMLQALTKDELNNELLATLPITVYDKAKIRKIWEK